MCDVEGIDFSALNYEAVLKLESLTRLWIVAD